MHVFGGLGVPVRSPTTAPNLESREDIRPELRVCRWSTHDLPVLLPMLASVID